MKKEMNPLALLLIGFVGVLVVAELWGPVSQTPTPTVTPTSSVVRVSDGLVPHVAGFLFGLQRPIDTICGRVSLLFLVSPEGGYQMVAKLDGHRTTVADLTVGDELTIQGEGRTCTIGFLQTAFTSGEGVAIQYGPPWPW